MPTSRLIILIAGNFFVATSFMAVAGLLTEIAESLNITIAQAGMLIAAFGFSAAVCAPTLATMGSRIDRRKLLTAAMAICALANLLAAVSQTFGQLVSARVLAAVTSAIYTPQVAATVSMLVSQEERAPTLAKLMMGWAIGSVLGNPLAVLIGAEWGWRVSFAAIGVASGVIAYLVWRTVPTGVKVTPLNFQRWIEVFRSKALVWLTAATALTNVGSIVMMSFIAPIVKEVQGIEGRTLALLLFTTGLGGFLGNLLSVGLVRRMGATKVAYKCNITAAAMLLIWPLAAMWWPAIFLVQFISSLGGAGFPAVQQARLVAVAPMLASATIALNSSVTYLGHSIGSSIGSTFWPLIPAQFMSWVGLIFIIAALLCSVKGDREARREAELGSSE